MPKVGRPSKELDWVLFEGKATWSGLEICAKECGISADTAERRIKEKYNMSFPEYQDKIARAGLRKNILMKQYQKAMRGNTRMLIHLGEVYCGQKKKVEITNPDGSMAPQVHIILPDNGRDKK